ncbi:AMP-binding protein [Haliea sp. E1-2-M8]|uniref:AMP-binding protein n=1 Tax=Haliea sp. E1-2-M8 TaxID=3064706 RepID=UPI00271F21A5|nr:AMP-binding protein [Haliea sp. E1-2-M8]MDO8863044.1 AMP-binding protein [Haliea sp. E1-2-M8]
MQTLDYNKEENRVLGNILRHQAETTPGKDFLIDGERHITYSEAHDAACHYAAGLRQLGVQQGDRVCIFMNSCPEFVLVSFACNLLGAPWVPINTDYRGEWLQQTLVDSKPRITVTDREYLSRLAELGDAFMANVVIKEPDAGFPSLTELLSTPIDSSLPAVLQRGDVASIMWTSGTTGRSKGVMQSHNAWMRAALSAANIGGMHEGDMIYNCMPLYNSAAWVTSIFPALVTGIAVGMDSAFSASHFWERTRFYGATHIFTLGAMHMFLWNAPERPDDSDNPVRSATMTPMPHDIHRPFCQRFGIQAIQQGFGQSEIMQLISRFDDGVSELFPNALGTPVDDLEVALLDDVNRPVPVGDVGEFCVKPKAEHILFNGYFNDPDATEKAFVDGWYRTGDLGKQDGAGNYFFVDRKKDLIRYKGRSVSSVAVESIARRHPGISDVAAFGVPSVELSSEHEIMLAVVAKPNSSVSEEALARHINDNAPYFFVPQYIEIVESLPMTPTQKVRKVELRERGVTNTTWDARAAGFKVTR